jgi:hypothetical protein
MNYLRSLLYINLTPQTNQFKAFVDTVKMYRHTTAARKASATPTPTAIVRKALKSIKAIGDLLSRANNIRTVVHTRKCITTLVTTIRKHEKKVSNALKKECYTLEGECADLYDKTYRRVLLTALNTCIQNVSKLNKRLPSVSDGYSSTTYNALIKRFYVIYRTTKNNEQANELEYQFTRVCAYFEMERERLMDQEWREQDEQGLVDQAWEKRHEEWEEEQEKWEQEEDQEEKQEEARVQLLLEYNCHAWDAKNMSSLEAVKTQFYELYLKCNYQSVICMNIRDMFMRTCQNTTIRLTD